MMSNPSIVLTPKEAEREYKYSHTTLYRDIASGKIEAIKRGRSTLLTRASLERAIASERRIVAKAG